MTLGSRGYYRAEVHTKALMVLIERTRGPFGGPPVRHALGEGIRTWGGLIQARAVRNVSGYPVVYDGQVFRVMVRTGALKGAIELQYPYQGPFTARVFVNGAAMNPGTDQPGMVRRPVPVSDYAMAVESGHGEIDLKKTMKGKTVPFFASRGAKSQGPFAARGLVPIDERSTGFGSRWTSETHNAKLAAAGKGPMVFEKKGGKAAFVHGGGGAYFISFRRVGDKGWVIPKAKPRPFMGAALQGTLEQGRLQMVKKVATALDPRTSA